jgi:hypothetical protein
MNGYLSVMLESRWTDVEYQKRIFGYEMNITLYFMIYIQEVE